MNDITTGEGSPSSTPSETDNDEAMAQRIKVLSAVKPRIDEIIDRLDMINRAIAANMPEFVTAAPLGDVVDMASEIAKVSEKLEKAAADIKSRISYTKEVSLPQRFDKDKVTTFNTERFRVTRLSRVLASIIGGEDGKDEAFQWLRDNEYGSLIKETVNSSSLSAAAKEVMEKGMELPEDLFNTITKDSVSITVKKPKRA